jgi:2,5-diketo-D-gluconate reductase A
MDARVGLPLPTPPEPPAKFSGQAICTHTSADGNLFVQWRRRLRATIRTRRSSSERAHMTTTQTTSSVSAVRLNDGYAIPQLGFGVFQIEPAETVAAVNTALEVGYRHIDTAEMYGNEREVGEAVRVSGLDRADVFITSKLSNRYHRPEDARRAFETTLAELGFEYVDLFLIHWPLPTLYGGDFVSTWKTLEEFRESGRSRSIGVSNFQIEHLERLASACNQPPAVNQIELHPYLLNEQVLAYDAAHEIATEAWSPIAQGAVLEAPMIRAIADKHGRSPAQVVLRWHIQCGNIVFPKSTTPSRIKENFQLFDFQLDADDRARIVTLDKGEAGRTGPHPDTFAHIPA